MILVERADMGWDRARVLEDISFTVRRGEMVGVLGPNGSGKSTLLSCLAGTLSPMSGKVRVGGREIAGDKPRLRARTVAVVPQSFAAARGVKVFDLTLMGRYAHTGFLAGYSDADREQAGKALAEAGCGHLAERDVATLSGGEFKRVLLARALAQDAPLLLLDEAGAGLDAARAVDLHELVARRNRQGGLTSVMAMHDLNLAALYCTRLMFLKNRRIALDGPVREVFTRENLAAVYEADVCVIDHPVAGTPQALVVPGAGSAGPGAS